MRKHELVMLGLVAILTSAPLAQGQSLVGDINGDGLVNNGDIDAFVALLTTGITYHAGPIAWYTFDGNTLDYAPPGNHGGGHGAPAFTDDVPPPLGVGQAIHFDGIDDYVRLLEPLPLNGTDYTVAFWIRTTDTSAYIIHSWAPMDPNAVGAAESFIVTVGVTGWMGIYQSGWGLPLLPAEDVFDGTWHHVAFTRALSTMTVDAYLDGQFVDSGVFGRPETIPQTTTIGWTANADYSPWAWFEGDLDDLRLYGRILSESEIAALALPPGWKHYSGHYYKLTPANAYWPDAEIMAESLGGHLVAINDAAEQQWVESAWPIGQAPNLWIGLSEVSPGVWEWVNADAVTFTNWIPGEPSGDGDYAELNHDTQYPGMWNDEHYQEQRGIVEVTPQP